jgi:iron complex outermembrane receptor protein
MLPVLRRSRFACLIGILCLTGLPAFNQVVNTDTARISLDEITITAARIPDHARQYRRITRIISKKEIDASPARDLAELLRYLPDIDVRQRGPIGVQADISLRGGTFDQFAILVNGINFNDPQTGHFQMDIPIPIRMIQRIEVLSGSDVKSLGANAFTGAINIVTGIPEVKHVNAGVSLGQHGLLEAGIDAGNHSGKWYEQAGLIFQKSDGYRENTDFNNLNGFFQTGYSQKRLNVSLMAGVLKKSFGANSFYTAKYPNQFERTGSGFTALTADLTGKINIRQSLYYRLHSDEFALFRNDPPAWYKAPNYHLSQIAGSKTDAWFTSVLGKTAFGLEIRRETIWSTVLGEISGTTKPVSGIAGIDYTRFGSRNHFSLSAEQQAVTGRFKWNGGVVFHQVQGVRNYFQVYPGMDVSYAPTRSLKAYLSMNRAFRLPSFTELYYQSPTNMGNPGLLPETAWHAETGAEWARPGFSARLMGFYRYASQSIDWVRTSTETIWHTENLGQIRTYGVETGLTITPVNQDGFRKFIDRLDVGYRKYFQQHAVDSYYSQYVLDYLKWKFTTGLLLKIRKSFRLSVNLVWQERNGTYTSFNAEQQITEVDYKPFMVTDVKLSYRYRLILITAECSNIFNREYFDISSIPQPGTWFRLGAGISLVGKH